MFLAFGYTRCNQGSLTQHKHRALPTPRREKKMAGNEDSWPEHTEQRGESSLARNRVTYPNDTELGTRHMDTAAQECVRKRQLKRDFKAWLQPIMGTNKSKGPAVEHDPYPSPWKQRADLC